MSGVFSQVENHFGGAFDYEVNPLKIAICEDDALCREQISQIILPYTNSKGIYVSFYSHPSALAEEVRRIGGFDLYILDIFLPGLTGIQLGAQLRREGFTGRILYLTSSPDYAIEAFKVQASGYLLKPVQKEALLRALEENIATISARNHKSLIVKTKEKTIKLDFDSIIYAELAKKTIVYHLVGGKKVESSSIRSTFSEAMQILLRDSRFVLCGSAKLINLHYVTELDTEELVFQNKSRLYIGRRACKELRSAWYDFWFDGGDGYDGNS